MSMLSETRWNRGQGLYDLKVWGIKPLELFLDDLWGEVEKHNGAGTETGRRLFQLYTFLDQQVTGINQKIDEWILEMDRAEGKEIPA